MARNEEVNANEEVESEAPATDLNVLVNEEVPEGFTKVNVTGDKNFASFAYNFGIDLDDMVGLFGAEAVFDAARQNMVVKLQQVTRPYVKKGQSPLAIRDAWKPGQKLVVTPKDPEEVAREFLAGKSQEELQRLFAEMQAASNK